MSQIHLIRHGQASFGAKDYDKLSPLGEQQASHLGQYFSEMGITAQLAVSGTMLRHQQTQQLCMETAGHSQLPVTRVELWNEFAHQEVLAAFNPKFIKPAEMKRYLSSFEKPEKQFIKFFALAIERWQSGDFDDQYPESWNCFKSRVAQGLSQLAESLEAGQDAWVFTSGGVISMVMLQLLDIPDRQFLQINKNILNCSVTTLKYSSHGLSLHSLNDHAAFSGEQNKHLITYK